MVVQNVLVIITTQIKILFLCPSCKESKGEIVINDFLTKKNITYKRQKTFKGCKSKSLLYFDFYLPDMDTCIEYDGEFHSMPIFGQKSLEDSIYRDNIKNEYCKYNNIRLIRISYTEFDKIEEILEKIL